MRGTKLASFVGLVAGGLIVAACVASGGTAAASWSWQQSHAEVTPTGDLEWNPAHWPPHIHPPRSHRLEGQGGDR